jgi:hypothetical protein
LEDFKPIIDLLAGYNATDKEKVTVKDLLPRMVKLDSTTSATNLEVTPTTGGYNDTASANLTIHRSPTTNNLYWTFGPSYENSYEEDING